MALVSSLQCQSFTKTFVFDIPNFLFHAKLISQFPRASLDSQSFEFDGLEGESYYGDVHVGSDLRGGIEFHACLNINFPDSVLDHNNYDEDDTIEWLEFNVGVRSVIKVSALDFLTYHVPILCFEGTRCHILSMNSKKFEDSNVFETSLHDKTFAEVENIWKRFSDNAGARVVIELSFFYTSEGSEWKEENLAPGVKNKLERPPPFMDHLTKKQKTDVTIECSGKEFAVHKLVLACASPVFDRMLDTDMSEKETGRIKIKDVQPETVQLMLNFLYTGKLFSEEESNEKPSDQVLIQLLDCAEKYGINELKNQVGHEICENLTVMNAIQFVDTLKVYGVDKMIVGKALEFCKKNLAAFPKDATFKNFLMEYTEALI